MPNYPPWFHPMYGTNLTIRDVFEQCVYNALVLAEGLTTGDLTEKRTVAFPALGTYGLKLVPTLDAKIMLSYILEFARTSRLSEIQILLDYPTLFNIFSRELHYLLHPDAARLPLSPQDQRVLIKYCSRYEHE